MVSRRASDRTFFGVLALLFAASTAATILQSASMPSTGGMPMRGGMMSMTWMRMPGQTWPGAATSFLGMWIVMMAAMMLPSLAPMLSRYRQAVDGLGEPRLGLLTALAGAAYFLVWAIIGIAVFPAGAVLMSAAMALPALAGAAPLVAGLVVLAAGLVQFTPWKARRLACCRAMPGREHALPPNAGAAWRYGLRLGLHCAACCANLTAVLLVLGVMDLSVMVLVTAAITAERLGPPDIRIARSIGAVLVLAGLLFAARAAGLG